MQTLVQLGRPSPARPIEVSERARTELRRLGVGAGRFMRIGVTAGGCAGTTYAATLDDELGAEDRVVFEADGLRIVAAGEEADKLAGLQIDYSDDLVTSGFRLTHANAARACGCGASFAL